MPSLHILKITNLIPIPNVIRPRCRWSYGTCIRDSYFYTIVTIIIILKQQATLPANCSYLLRIFAILSLSNAMDHALMVNLTIQTLSYFCNYKYLHLTYKRELFIKLVQKCLLNSCENVRWSTSYNDFFLLLLIWE